MRKLLCAAAFIAAASQSQAATWDFAGYTDYAGYTGDQAGLYKTQGIAWNPDRQEWVTSWQFGLSRTDADFNILQKTGGFDLTTMSLTSGIPEVLAAQGFDHIGDIDVANGVIYASLDSEAGDYQNGHVAMFDASDLHYLGMVLPMAGAPDNLHDDLASWVAVDAPKGLAYGKEWQLGDTLNVYDLDDFSLVGTLTMGQSLKNIQGAKVLGDTMYMAAHDSTKSVYALDMSSGHVEELFRLPTVAGAYNETEGIGLRQHADGSVEMYVEMIITPDNDDARAFVRLFHYTSPDAAPAPVPLPATLPLAAGALGALATLRRRRRG